MRTGRGGIAAAAVVLVAATVAGCTSSSTGQRAPSASSTVTATATPTATATVISSPPATTASTSPTAATSGGRTTATGPALCTPTVMTFRLGQGNGAAGTEYQSVVATDRSRQPCVTTGYPGVAALDASGRQIAQAARDPQQPVTTIVVQPGQQISAVIVAASMGTGGADCPRSVAVLFTLPDNTDSTRIVAGLPACADGVRVRAFVRGAL